MAISPGKYDELCTYVREQAKAEGAIVMVFNGDKGTGFSAQLPLHAALVMPDVLRDVADEIERSHKEGNP